MRSARRTLLMYRGYYQFTTSTVKGLILLYKTTDQTKWIEFTMTA
jgi:hypothetical protein